VKPGVVPLALLSLLAEEPRNGYQLMQAIRQRSGGRWRPSSGSVYPALAKLRDRGMIEKVDGGASVAFEINAAGLTRLAQSRALAAPWEGEEKGTIAASKRLASLRSRLESAVEHVVRTGSPGHIERATAELRVASQAMREIVAGCPRAGRAATARRSQEAIGVACRALSETGERSTGWGRCVADAAEAPSLTRRTSSSTRPQ
jgi:DNA-binding PadR family transcriptional regulator